VKIAVPLFGERVSPHFCTAPEMLVVLAEGTKVLSELRFDFTKISLSARRSRLLTLGVDTIICGGIAQANREWFERRGVKVIDNMRGNSREALLRSLNEGEKDRDNK
jgi:predicted Fe-Mo cluster-binding NifX family protein